MNEDALNRLSTLFGLEEKLRSHPKLKRIQSMIMNEIQTYEDDPALLDGVEKPQPPTPNPAAQHAPAVDRTGFARTQPGPFNETTNNPTHSPGGQPNRRT